MRGDRETGGDGSVSRLVFQTIFAFEDFFFRLSILMSFLRGFGGGGGRIFTSRSWPTPPPLPPYPPCPYPCPCPSLAPPKRSWLKRKICQEAHLGSSECQLLQSALMGMNVWACGYGCMGPIHAGSMLSIGEMGSLYGRGASCVWVYGDRQISSLWTY